MRSGGLILLMWCVGAVGGQQAAPKLLLGDLLRKNDIPAERLPSAERGQEVAQWMAGRDGAKVLIAYSLPEDDGAEVAFFHLLRYDRWNRMESAATDSSRWSGGGNDGGGDEHESVDRVRDFDR